MQRIGIYFASQTGTAESYASTMKKEAEKEGLQADIIDLSEVSESNFLDHQYKIMLMATHYEGNSPDNAAEFWSWFSLEDEIPQGYLQNYKYTVFALGDESYENFAKIGRETDRLMEKYGGERVYNLGIGNDEEGMIGKYFRDWRKNIWSILKAAFYQDPEQIHQEVINRPIPFPFSTILSSFYKEEPLSQFRKKLNEYSFKTKNYLHHEQLEIRKPVLTFSEYHRSSTEHFSNKLFQTCGVERSERRLYHWRQHFDISSKLS